MLFNILLINNSNNVYIAETYKLIMQQNCINFSIKINKDTEDRRIARTIENVALGNRDKINIIATYFIEEVNNDFREFLLRNLTDAEKEKHNIVSEVDLTNDVISKLNINTLKSVINKYYRLESKDVDAYDSKEANQALDGFSSHYAKYVAKCYCANIILKLYHSSNTSKNLTENLKRTINDEFISLWVEPMIDEILNNDSYHFTDSHKAEAKKLKDLFIELRDIQKERTSLKKNNKIRKEDKAKYNELTDKITKLQTERKILIYNLSRSVPAAFTSFRNYATMWDKIMNKESSKEWYAEIFRLKRLVNGKNLFTVLTEEEKQYQSVNEDEDSWMNFDNDDSIDLTAKTWSESIAKSYEQNVANDVKLYLASIDEVSLPVEKGQDENTVSFSISEELGTRIGMSAEFMIQQLSNLNFTSQEDFLDAVWEASQTIPELYCLGVLYNRMAGNPILLNRIYVEIGQNKQYKIQAYVSTNGNNIAVSNQEINSTSNILYKLVTSAISTYKTVYLYEDTNKLNKYVNNAEKIFGNPILKQEAIEYILDYVSKYFPNIPTNNFRNYLNRSTLTAQEFKNFFNLLNNFQKQIGVIKSKFLEVEKEFSEKNREYQKKVKERDQEDYYGALFGEFDSSKKKEKLVKPVRDYSKINYDSLYEKLLPLAKELVKTTLVDNQLNSYNAENNMASDLLPNSRITNILKQINYEYKDEKGNVTQAGLERLKEFITKDGKIRSQFLYSNLFFGSGNTKGIFIKEGDRIVGINKEAKDLIRVALFDGIKDRENNKGVLYQGMSKGDYFMTMLEVFHSNTNFYDNSHKDKGGYFMRTPSDAPKNFIIQTTKYKYTSLVTPNGINKNSDFFLALKNILLGEINDFIAGVEVLTENGVITSERKEKYFEHYHYNKRKGIFKDGRLTGNVFKFIKLPETVTYDLQEDVIEALSLYGQDNTSLINVKGDTATVSIDKLAALKKGFTEEQNNALDSIIEKWINAFNGEIARQSSKFSTIVGDRFNEFDIKEAMFNYVVAYNKFDELFEGDSKFYADPRTFLKRAKEAQAGGKAYAGFSFNEPLTGSYIERDNVFADIPGNEELHPELKAIKSRNGFRAITITNTIKSSKYADAIEEEMYQSLLKQGKSEEVAKEEAKKIAKKYRGNTKTNDAQSYITIEEFIRRRYADGTINLYKDLLNELYNLQPDENGNYDTSSIDLNKFNARIQVQKNYYYDIYEDPETGLLYPRQIKNAEFVLVPQLLKAGTSLRKLYDIMKANDISQINTSETSKAAKKNVLQYWDNEGKVTEEGEKEFINAIQNNNVIETYYYRSLYKQQDIPSHLKDQRNKAGIQIMKKVVDNYHTASPEVRKAVDEYFEAYCSNIKESFYNFIDSMDWKYDPESNTIVNKDGNPTLNFDKYYELGRAEATRLGLDSNFIDYLVPTNNGEPIMPNYMNNVSTKLESIAQSMFNNHITRQTLPGWHCAQVTNIGFDRELKYHKDRYVKKGTTFIITKEEYDVLSEEEKSNYEEAAVVDILLPRWSNLIPKGYTIEKLRKEGLTIMVGYRIPTEGKQSVCIFNVLDFIDDIYDSTVVVPDEWVEQTGSDMDGDSVYTVIYPMIWDAEQEKLVRVTPNLEESEEATKERYLKYIQNELNRTRNYEHLNLLNNTIKDTPTNLDNTLYIIVKKNGFKTLKEFSQQSIIEQNTKEQKEAIIVENMIKIMLDYSSREENITGSHFEDLKQAMNKYERNNTEIDNSINSVYNPFTQLLYMENAMSGARLKAFSVNRDTFNSLCNKGKAVLGKDHKIVVSYPVEGEKAQETLSKLRKRFGTNKVKLIEKETKIISGKLKDGAPREVTLVDYFIEITHDKFGWSVDNKNIEDKILTAYSSQTTAHILDAIKEGTIFNENEYTFAVFKTLLDVGIDFDTAIAFIMQPGITKVNDSYFETNSLYINSYGTPANNALREIAKALNIKINGKEIDYYTSIDNIIAILNNHKELNEAMVELYGIESGKIFTSDYIINKELLVQRLQQGYKLTDVQKVAIDLATILTFKKIKQTSDNIEEILNQSKPDRFGAKQTIRETRIVSNKINKYTDSKNPIARTLVIWDDEKETYIPFLSKLYAPNSFYPYIDYFYRYSTRQSVAINKQLFKLESDVYVENEAFLEDLIGRELTTDEYKQFKQYIVASTYNGIETLVKPLTVDSKGNIVIDVTRLDEYSAYDNGYSVADKERFRIYGFEESNEDALVLEDFNNPTESEIAHFNRLSPAEKVLWIQSNFNGNTGIFGLLNVRTFNYNEVLTKGYSTSLITYNDTGKDSDELIAQFDAKYHSKHPFIKIAMLDLIKYAFFVEGFNFKSGNISKIVSNKSILDLHLPGGLSVVDNIKNQIGGQTLFDLNTVNERFVRSHPSIVPNITIKSGSTLESGFLQSTVVDDLYGFELNSGVKPEVKEFIEYLLKGKDHYPKYIRITRKVGDKNVTTLYKVDSGKIIKGELIPHRYVYLYPINLLESKETTEVSSNIHNNNYRPQAYYEDLIRLNEGLEFRLKEYNIKNSKLDKENPEIREELLRLKEEHTIKQHEFNRVVQTLENPNTLIELSESSDKFLANEVKTFMKKVTDAVQKPGGRYKLIQYPGYRIKALFNVECSKDTIIPFKLNVVAENGQTYTVVISKYKMSTAAYNTIRGNKVKKNAVIDIEEQFLINDYSINKDLASQAYRIDTIIDEELEKKLIDAHKNTKERLSATSSFSEMYDIDVVNNEFPEITTITKKIVDNIRFNKRAAVVSEREMFMKNIDKEHIDVYSLTALYDNNELVFRSIAEYYKNVTTKLLKDIEEFRASNGRIYNIGDASLYEHLVKDNSDYAKVVDILLRAKNISHILTDLFNLNIDSESQLTKDYINKLQKYINSVTQNTSVRDGFKHIFNIYFAKKYSNNPNVKNGLVLITEQFGDANKADLLLSDVEELDNKQVQVVAKMVYSIVSEAEQVTGPQAAIKFEKAYDAIMAKSGELDFDKIIDEHGQFIKPFNDNFIKDKKEKYEELTRIREKYGKRSKEYLDAKLAYDEWKVENVEQEVVEEYYRQSIAITKKLYNKAQDLYIKYINIKGQLEEIENGEDTPENARNNKAIQLQIKELFSSFNPDGTLKSQIELNKITALKTYFAERNLLQEQYFTKKVNEEFLELVKFYEKIIKDYDAANRDKSIEEKLQNDNYSKAYYWLAQNGHYDIVGEAKAEIIEAFSLLRNENTRKNAVLNALMKQQNRTDAYGEIDGRLFSDEEIDKIRKEVVDSFNTEDYNESDATLIKDIPGDEKVYNKEYYDLFSSTLSPEQKSRKRELQYKINNILIKGFDTNNHLSTKLLFERCTIEELSDLAKYYKELRTFKSTMTKAERNKLNNEVDFLTNDLAFNIEYDYYRTNLANDKVKSQLWKEIFLDWEFNEIGQYIIRLNDGMSVVANNMIYGYANPKAKYINKEKTDAKKFIDDHVEFITTEYYDIAQKAALENGTHEEWFKRNHVYNPYRRKWEPLAIWTKMSIKPNSRYADSYQFIPNEDNIDRAPKANKRNENYGKVPGNYKGHNYDNPIQLNKKEEEMLKLLQDTIAQFTFYGAAEEFAKQGYVPRRYKTIEDTRYYVNQALGVVGLDYKSYKNDEFYDRFDFNNDEDIVFNMLDFIKGKGYKKTKPLMPKLTGETDTEWKERNKDIIEYNEKVKADNLAIDNSLMDRNWKSVFHDFVVNATIYEARNKIKDSLYLLLQSLKDNKAYDVSSFGRVKTTKHSSKELLDYQMTEQNNYYSVVENWARRLVHSQFKEKSKFREFADLMQNVTSAKYMILNVTGGIANITTGLTNIMGENFAKDYFGGKEFAIAQKRYFGNVTNFISQMYQDTSDNYEVALTKYFDVVDFDAMLERKSSGTVGEKIERARDLLYSLQAGGEHYMQNSVLFAMLQSTRIYEEDGRQIIGSFAEYINNVEKKALLKYIGDNRDLIVAYKNYIAEIKSDANKKKDIDRFNYNAYLDFAKNYFTKEQLKEFIKERDNLIKLAKVEFEKLDTVESQLTHINGRIQLKDDAKITDLTLQEFRRKVISVNKLIHGVYDKYGAARLERKWYGTLVMQYHKHLYPGIMKRYRGLFGSGYYNELRGGVAYGSYVSFYKFLTTDFRKLNFKDDNGEFIGVLESIKNIGKATIDSIINISLNWSTMTEWEKRNCRRALGDLAGVASALLMAILLHTLTDDDELKNSDLLSTGLYLIDRLNTEASMYTPWGMVTEFKTLYSSPLAMSNLPMDILKALELSAQWIFNEDFNPYYENTQYAGENKIWVRLRRNIPIYRVYDRLTHMANHNQYYRIGDNNWNIKLAKQVADIISPEN